MSLKVQVQVVQFRYELWSLIRPDDIWGPIGFQGGQKVVTLLAREPAPQEPRRRYTGPEVVMLQFDLQKQEEAEKDRREVERVYHWSVRLTMSEAELREHRTHGGDQQTSQPEITQLK
jgi:hypothetical protein